jgi:hypothetical protein
MSSEEDGEGGVGDEKIDDGGRPNGVATVRSRGGHKRFAPDHTVEMSQEAFDAWNLSPGPDRIEDDPLGGDLYSKDSTIPNAGKGLFVGASSLERGTFYPFAGTLVRRRELVEMRKKGSGIGLAVETDRVVPRDAVRVCR